MSAAREQWVVTLTDGEGVMHGVLVDSLDRAFISGSRAEAVKVAEFWSKHRGGHLYSLKAEPLSSVRTAMALCGQGVRS